jgi:hypothetical protein
MVFELPVEVLAQLRVLSKCLEISRTKAGDKMTWAMAKKAVLAVREEEMCFGVCLGPKFVYALLRVIVSDDRLPSVGA